MEQKKTKLASLALPEKEHRIMFEILIAGIVLLASAAFPFLKYSYQGKVYGLSGISLLTGKTVCGGKIVLTTSIPMVLIIIAGIVLVISAVATVKVGQKKMMLSSCIASVVSFIANLYLASSAVDTLSRAKNVHVGAGSIICMVCSIIVVIWTMYMLWKLKVASALDFMAIPGMLYFVINNYIPMLGIVIAFKKVDYSVGIMKSPWAGLSNFKQLFSSTSGNFWNSDAFLITKNTLLYNIVFILLGTLMGIVVGICLADIFSKAWQKFFQTSILLPQLISYVIVAYIVYAMFSNDAGLVNHMLGEGNEINFYAAPKYWPFILIFIYVWKMVGYNAIIFLSSIVGIDRSIYEAARVDGAGKFKQIFYITLPMLKPTVITLVMLNVGRIMYSDFGLFYQVPMDSGALYSVTNTIDTYVYRCLMTLNNISTSSAACTYQAIVGFILVLVVNTIVRRKDKENALF